MIGLYLRVIFAYDLVLAIVTWLIAQQGSWPAASVCYSDVTICGYNGFAKVRLELVAAVLAVKISALIKKELEMKELTEYSWTDSKVVLGYIANDSRAFKTFVANRVQAIQEYSNPNQWMAFKIFSNITRWFQGPARLWEPQSRWENSSDQEINQNATSDFEWKKHIKVGSVITKEDLVSSLENRYSC